MSDLGEPEKNKDFQEWLDYGYKQGWCLPTVVCQTHDGVPMTANEEEEFNDGSDPCIHVVRFFDSEADLKDAVKNLGQPLS